VETIGVKKSTLRQRIYAGLDGKRRVDEKIRAFIEKRSLDFEP
jgi:hypothetical protein